MKKIIFFFIIIFILYSCKKTNKTEINFAYYDTNKASLFIKNKVDEYNKNNPEIKIIGNKLPYDEFIAGFKKGWIKPDLVRYSSNFLEELADKKIIAGLNDYFDSSFFDLFKQEALSTVTYKKKIFGIPDNFGNHLLVFYNKKLISEIPETSDELLKILEKKLRYRNDIKGLVFNQNDLDIVFPFFYGFKFDTQLDNENIELEKSEILNTLDFIYNLKFKYNLLSENCNYKEAEELFKSGKAVIIIDGFWSFNDYKKNLSKDLGVSDFPIISFSGKKPVFWSSTNSYAVIKKRINTKEKKVAAFIKYMTSVKVQEEWLDLNRLPSANAQLIIDKVNKYPLLNESYQILLKTKTKPSNRKINLIAKAIRPHLNAMMEGRISPDAASYAIENYYQELKKSNIKAKNAKK